MFSKEAKKQKIEALLQMMQGKLDDLNALPSSRIKYERQLDELEYMVGNMKIRLQELHKSGEDL